MDKVRQLAYNQIQSYGMGESMGLMSFPSTVNEDYQKKPFSKSLQHKLDMVGIKEVTF